MHIFYQKFEVYIIVRYRSFDIGNHLQNINRVMTLFRLTFCYWVEYIDSPICVHNFDTHVCPIGGLIYTRDSIQSKRITDLEMQDLEVVWIEITVKSKHILIEGCYRQPHSNTPYFNKKIKALTEPY